MAKPLICNTKRIRDELYSRLADPRLEFVLYALAGYMLMQTGYGIRLTSLCYYPEVDSVKGRVRHSKHQINPDTEKCEAADLNPPWAYEESLWKVWRYHAKKFLDDHTEGVDSVIHGSVDHLHVEIHVKLPATEVVLG